MGGSSSKQQKPQRVSKQEDRRRALQRNGVLIPPSYLVGTDLPLTPHVLDRLAVSPSYLQYLHETDLSHRLLTDYLTSGLWIATRAAPACPIRIAWSPTQAARMHATFSTSSGNTSDNDTSLRLVTQLDVSPQDGQAPRLSVSLPFSLHPSISGALFGQVQNGSTGQLPRGWWGAYLDATTPLPGNTDNDDSCDRPNLRLQVGTWLPWMLPKKNKSGGGAHQTSPWREHNDDDALHAYAAVHLAGATAAVETKVPLQEHAPNYLALESRSYFTTPLLSSSSSPPSDSNNNNDMPPVYLTLEQTPETASLSLTQILTTDRLQLNPWEDRAPLVRNGFAWTARFLQDKQQSTQMGSDETSTIPSTRVQLGAAWQMNRNVACKAVLEGNQLTAALVVKKWQQPGLTVSVLHRRVVGEATSAATGSWGCAVELDMGGPHDDSNTNNYATYPDPPPQHASRGQRQWVPETKTSLPGES